MERPSTSQDDAKPFVRVVQALADERSDDEDRHRLTIQIARTARLTKQKRFGCASFGEPLVACEREQARDTSSRWKSAMIGRCTIMADEYDQSQVNLTLRNDLSNVTRIEVTFFSILNYFLI